MVVAHRVRHHAVEDLAVGRVGARRDAGERSVEGPPHLVGHRPPDGLLAATGQVVDEVVDDPVRQRAEGVPVLGVETRAAVGCGEGTLVGR